MNQNKTTHKLTPCPVCHADSIRARWTQTDGLKVEFLYCPVCQVEFERTGGEVDWRVIKAFKAAKVQTKQTPFPCLRCEGGKVLVEYDGYRCCNCGAEHSSDGNLIKPSMEIVSVGRSPGR